MFRLERGATGFYSTKNPPLPEIDLRVFRGAWHAAAWMAGGVGNVAEEYPRTYHTASLRNRDGLHLALCHMYLPLVALVSAERFVYEDEFRDPPAWSRPLVDCGLTVMNAEQLTTPLSDVDAAVLTEAERREIRYWGITMLGGVLFNSWD